MHRKIMIKKYLKIYERKILKKETWKNPRKRKIAIYCIYISQMTLLQNICDSIATISQIYRLYYNLRYIAHTMANTNYFYAGEQNCFS